MAIFEQHILDDKTDEWATPKSLLRPLAESVGGFDLDPCSGAEKDPHAAQTYTKEDDGLTSAWFGTVFCNPPFSEKVDWIEKAVGEVNEENAECVVMVLPVDTSTNWFHDHVTDATVVCFLGPGRVDFDRRGDAEGSGSPSFAVMLAVFGDIPRPDLLGFLSTRGVIYWNRALHRETTQMRFE